MDHMSKSQLNSYARSLAFWTMSSYYLNLVQAALGETIKQGNTWVVTSDQQIDWKKYDEATKWSDFNIIVPLLYNFYHALELLLKGFVLLKKTGRSVKLDHDIQRLLSDFCSQYPDQYCLASVLSKYIGESITSPTLSIFFQDNDCTSNRFYELLRYPADPILAEFFTYMQLQYKGGEAVPFFKELQNDIECIPRRSVSLGRMFEH